MDDLLKFLGIGAAAYLAYKYLSKPSNTTPIVQPSQSTGTTADSTVVSPSPLATGAPGQFSSTPTTPTVPTLAPGSYNPGGIPASPIAGYSASQFAQPAKLPTQPHGTASWSTGPYPPSSDMIYRVNPADAAAMSQQISAADAANVAQLQANVAAGQAAFAASHATSVYCGPGCYRYYDAQGNLTGQLGTPGSSAGSLLSNVASGVTGFEGR